jgi:hypothetical protein
MEGGAVRIEQEDEEDQATRMENLALFEDMRYYYYQYGEEDSAAPAPPHDLCTTTAPLPPPPPPHLLLLLLSELHAWHDLF